MNPALYVALSLGQFVVPYLLFAALVIMVMRRYRKPKPAA